MNLRRLIAICIAAFIANAPLAHADDPSEAVAHEVFNTVMSPFCPGRLLNDCPSSSATELKDKIRTELRSGKSKEQVLEEVYSTFGSELRAAPENKGFGTVAWWTPVLFLVVGGITIAAWLKRTQSSGAAEAPESEREVSPEMRRRIEEELNRFES